MGINKNLLYFVGISWYAVEADDGSAASALGREVYERTR